MQNPSRIFYSFLISAGILLFTVFTVNEYLIRNDPKGIGAALLILFAVFLFGVLNIIVIIYYLVTANRTLNIWTLTPFLFNIYFAYTLFGTSGFRQPVYLVPMVLSSLHILVYGILFLRKNP